MNEVLVGADPAPTTADLPVILTRAGDTAPRWRAGERLHHLFETVAAARPAAVAVETADRSLSFAELDGEANRTAWMLRARGLGSHDAIALLFGRTAEAYVALLAVLKIGAVYVPLDLAQPAQRMAYVAADAGCRAVLTMAAFAERAAGAGVPVLSLDTLAEERGGFPPDRRVPDLGAAEDAYVIYTSGSTGRPKGVRISHRSIVSFVRVAAETYGYRPGDRVYQGLTLAFDFSVEEIWVPLVAGATLVPSESPVPLVGSDLRDFLDARRITAVCCVPTLLSTIEEDLPDLRLMIVSGEACPDELAQRWLRPGRTILNAYGPTEITVTATVAVLAPGEPVSLGLPLASYMVVILDPDAPRALGSGRLGEIGIAGIGLSPGYVGRDDLTAKAFVEDFLGLPDNPSGRIYRTGDLGRVNDAGLLEYHGRIDTQVKVRGYRIELTEIESAILQQPGVHQAVVAAFDPEPGLTELVAYFAAETSVTPEAIAGGLRDLLPAFMLPAYYERLPEIAMLPSGKADRRALPRPCGGRLLCRGAAFSAPDGEIEACLARALRDILKLEQVSADDDFFADLGATSLLMARFSTRIRTAFPGLDVSMRDIYLAPSIRRLGRVLAGRAPMRASTASVPADEPHIAPDLAYWGTGAYQLGVGFLLAWGAVVLITAGLDWVRADTVLETYGRAVGFSAFVVALLFLTPVALKWLIVGRWRAGSFPIWGIAYARFWTVKVLISASPFSMLPGTPLYNAFVKALGARVAWSAVVLGPPPICTDLVTVGPQAVVGRNVRMLGYKAVSGRIVTGPVAIGARAFVGDGCVLDVHSRIEDDADLAHASALHEGQVVGAGRSGQGSPAEATGLRFRRLEPADLGVLRRAGHAAAQLAIWVLVYGPMVVAADVLTFERDTAEGGVAAWMPDETLGELPLLLAWAAFGYFGSILFGFAVILVVPRLAWRFLRAGVTYRLFGIRHFLLQTIVSASNSRFFNQMFGDSSFVVNYLRLVGYRFPEMRQTGSNFGVEFRHDVPFLCEFGSGTMISDSIVFANTEFSNAAFRVDWTRFGANNFVGNNIIYHPASRTGDNVLFGTKALVPIHGPLRENTGLLGAPVFEIPRSVAVEPRLARFRAPAVMTAALRGKDRYNLATIGVFLAVRFGWVAIAIVLTHAMLVGLGMTDALGLAVMAVVLWMLSLTYSVVVERASRQFRPLQPRTCSIYEPYFWWHERYWKFLVDRHKLVLSGTPFLPLLWRALGARVGRKLYDEGCDMTERTLVTIGDNCTLNSGATLQSHSLEDGIFRSGRIVVGDGVTFGVGAFAHYGTTIGDAVLLDTDSFLMKGESPAAGSRWAGNPAHPVSGAIPVVSGDEGSKSECESIVLPANADAAVEGGAAVAPLQQSA
jgi:non-ribosomal peptide synthetase-like protein